MARTAGVLHHMLKGLAIGVIDTAQTRVLACIGDQQDHVLRRIEGDLLGEIQVDRRHDEGDQLSSGILILVANRKTSTLNDPTKNYLIAYVTQSTGPS